MKGVANIIEAVIGAMIILGVMMYLFTSTSPILPETGPEGTYETIYDCLVYAKDYSDIENKFDECIPSSYEIADFKICDTTDCSMNTMLDVQVYVAEYIDEGPRLIKVAVYP